jgi:hypothetical protein
LQHRRSNPFIPKPEPKEIPVTEELVAPAHKGRPVHLKPPETLIVPRFNRMYGSLRTSDGWRYLIDNIASGTVITSAGATATAAVNLLLDPHWRLEQWPGGTQVYLVIRQFSIAPQTATFATLGALDITFLSNSGYVIPLGDIVSSGSEDVYLTTIIPSPLTDPDVQGVGTLQVALNAGATVGTYNWQMGFSGAYLLPDLKGYDVIERGTHERSVLDYHH